MQTKVVWSFLEVFWFSKGNTTRHSEWKKGEVDRRRSGKTIVKSRQGCALPADLEQLKQDRLKIGLLRSHLWYPNDIARL